MLKSFKECLCAKYIHVENDASYCVKKLKKTDGTIRLKVYFEWSNGATDWKNNFNFPAKPYRKMHNLWFCHRGFLKVWKSIEPYISEDILDTSVTEINIVGYSHGGAVAQLCYEYVKYNRPDVTVTGLGFGAPRVLWGFASRAVRNRFKGFEVIRNCCDVVTYAPPAIFGFRHICEVVEIGTDSKGPVDDHKAGSYLDSLMMLEELEKETV